MIVACAHGPPPPLHSTRLIVREAGGGFLPFVHANVAGEAISLLVDTGATQSILPMAFARAHKLAREMHSGDPYFMDANGHRVQMQLLSGVPVQFEGEASGGNLDFMANSYEADDDGVLAPQALVERGWALVIDLGREELRYEPEQEALKRLRADSSAALKEVDFHRCLDEGLFERSHRYVPVTINGVAASMLVDTGASTTVVNLNNPVLPSMEGRQATRQEVRAMSSTGANFLVEDVRIAFAETRFVLDVMVSPAQHTCGHGALGADIFRHCALLWGYSSLWVACRAPAVAPAAR